MERSVAGNILIEALFAGVVISATAAAFITHLDMKQKDLASERVRLGLLGVETNLRQNLLDDQAWTLTMKAPENSAVFACAGCTGTKCVATQVSQFRTFNGSGNPVLDGVDEAGRGCDAAANRCLYEAAVTWKPICANAGTCVPTQAQISIQWSKTQGAGKDLRNIRIPGLQTIIKNFPPVPVSAFRTVVAQNATLKNSDCECGTQSVYSRFKIDLAGPGEYLTVQFCQPKGYSPPGQAAYRLTFCGEKGKPGACDLDCDTGYNLIQTVPFEVPGKLGFQGYSAKIGVCENPVKTAMTPSAISITKNEECPFGTAEQSSTPLDLGSETMLLRICSRPR